MNKKIYFYGLRYALLLASTFLAVLLGKWISETYLFDKLYYYKSTDYGYLIPGSSDKSFGKRSEDLMKLQAFLKSDNSNTLGATSENKHTIVVIGDSYVWGQGIRNEERFSVLLEKKLNKTAPVKVVSLGRCGNDIFDDYVYFRDIQKMIPHIDGYVFALVNNDLIFNTKTEDQETRDSYSSHCQSPLIYDTSTISDTKETYARLMHASYSESNGNLCLYHQIVPLLPKNNAIYLAMEYFQSDEYLEKYIKPLEDAGYHVVVPDYQSFIPFSQYAVSKRDGHPSKYMQEVYADILYKEVLQTGMISQ